MSLNPASNATNANTYINDPMARAPRDRAAVAVSAGEKPAKTAASSEKQDGFSFWDLVDIINPLQHIPVVNTLYRDLTGDKIGNFARVAGGTLFGGFAGAALAGINAIAVNETGNDVGEMALAKAGLREANPLPAQKQDAQKAETIPMIEVRPEPQRTAMKDIIWDAPSLLQVAAQEPVRVEKPVQVASAEKPAGQKPMDHVVTDVPEKAYEMPLAMPDPKSLNEIEPGNPESPMPTYKAAENNGQVPNTMMQALAKYQAMQRMGGDDAATANAEPSRPVSQQKFAKLGNSIRRY